MFRELHCIDSTSPGGSRRSEVPPSSLNLLDNLLNFDQLRRERALGHVFRDVQEGPIQFLPTFKYDKGTDCFDSSSKARVPAWTDRVLYLVRANEETECTLKEGNHSSVDHTADTNKEVTGDNVRSEKTAQSSTFGLTLRSYNSLDVKHSDHRPVFAQFEIIM